MTLTALGLLLLSGAALVQGNLSQAARGGPPEPPLRILTLDKTAPLGMPTFGFVGSPVCDASGNLYFEAVNPGIHQVDIGPFIRVSADGKQQTIILPPSGVDGTRQFYAVFQAVSPDGSYYLLGHRQTGDVLIRYKGDGSILRETKLLTPADAYPQMFAVADSGIVYVSGYSQREAGTKPRQAFAGLYSANGTRIADLSAGLKPFDLTSSAPFEGAVKAGQDSLFYVLQGGVITVFDQSGALEKKFSFQRPGDRWSAVRLDVSGGLAAIRLVAPEPQENGIVYLTTRLLLIDLQTGETRGQYAFAPGTPGAVICFSRQDGFSVYGVEKGQAVREWYGWR